MDSNDQNASETLPFEILLCIAEHMDTVDLLPVAAVSRSLAELACSIVKARLKALISSSRATQAKVILFETSCPNEPSRLLQHPLVFDGFRRSKVSADFHTNPSGVIAAFKFQRRDASSSKSRQEGKESDLFSFAMDSSFQTFLMSVRLTTEASIYAKGTMLYNAGRRDETDLAEGMERVWKTWFDATLFSDDSSGRHARQISRDTIQKDFSRRSLSIDKTIARANLLLFPPTMELPQPVPSRVAFGPAVVPSRRVETFSLSWESIHLNAARVLVNYELQERRRARSIVLYIQPR